MSLYEYYCETKDNEVKNTKQTKSMHAVKKECHYWMKKIPHEILESEWPKFSQQLSCHPEYIKKFKKNNTESFTKGVGCYGNLCVCHVILWI